MIELKSEHEINLIRAAGRIVRFVLQKLGEIIKPGICTIELDRIAEEIIKSKGAISAFKGYRGFPGHICTSINEEVIHGIPGQKALNLGDIISIDVGVKFQGFFADSAMTFKVDNVSERARHLIDITRQSLYIGIDKALPGNRVSDISCAIQTFVEANGYSVVRAFVGHGIGKKMHEEPAVPNFGRPNTGPRLRPGMVIAIEPMVNEGNFEVEVLADNWTAVTKDRLLSAHFEHTVCVTEKGPEILT